jgi:hypothetical protein
MYQVSFSSLEHRACALVPDLELDYSVRVYMTFFTTDFSPGS